MKDREWQQSVEQYLIQLAINKYVRDTKNNHNYDVLDDWYDDDYLERI